MKLEGKLNELKHQIIEAFENVPYPKSGIALHECDECRELRESFTGQNWRTISSKIVEKHYGQIPLFSDEAFPYFLPAYLIYSLENFNDNLVCEFTIYALTPTKKQIRENFDYWKEKFQKFDNKQMDTIYEFLYLIKENEENIFGYNFGINVKRLENFKESIG